MNFDANFLMAGLQKSGYLQVKEPSNIKGRRLKTWRHKWVVLQGMSNLASGTLAAKLELYQSEASAYNKSQDKVTYLLENVTAVEPCHSKTHKLAFQIVRESPVLVLCGDSEFTTNAWITILKKIFFPVQNSFDVEILQNKDAKRFFLSGQYKMSVSPEAVTVSNTKRDEAMGWRLETLKRFYMENGKKDILIIESGAKAECGEAKFEFCSKEVSDILDSIKNNIQIAINEKRQNSNDKRTRALSTSSFEQGFQNLLLNSQKARTSSIGSSASGGSNDTTISRGNSENNFRIIGESEKPRSASVNLGRPENLENVSYATVSKEKGTSKLGAKGHRRSSSFDCSPMHSQEKLNLDGKRTSSCEIQKHTAPYDKLKIKHNLENAQVDIVSKMKIRSPGHKEIEVLVDQYGYSHVSSGEKGSEKAKNDTDLIEKKEKSISPYHNIDETSNILKDGRMSVLVADDRIRTASGTSADSLRSSSVGSHDSGVSSLPNDRASKEESDTKSRDGSSFDSEISSEISVTVSEAIVVSRSDSDLALKLSRSSSHPSTSSLDSKSNPTGSDEYSELPQSIQNQSKHNRSKSDPVGYESVESEYEELDKYRKDLKQFLGMDPNKSPEQVPPSLPDRPSTMPAKRKQLDKRKKKVSFPLISKPRKNTRSDSMSSSSSDEEEKPDSPSVVSMSAWPIDKKRVPNSLYESSEPNCELNKLGLKGDLKPSDSSGNISSLPRWPLAMSARANCNRFYSSTGNYPQLTKLGVSQAKSNSQDLSSDRVDVSKEDDFVEKEHIYASVEAKLDKLASDKPAEDFLTGDQTYVSSSVLPIIQPSSISRPLPNFDLLTDGDINSGAHVDTLLSPEFVSQSANSGATGRPNSRISEDTDETLSNLQVRTRRKGEVTNPFPNLARYSGPIEDLLSNDSENNEESQKSDTAKLSTEENKPDSDPFDIFHMGVFPTKKENDLSSDPFDIFKLGVFSSKKEEDSWDPFGNLSMDFESRHENKSETFDPFHIFNMGDFSSSSNSMTKSASDTTMENAHVNDKEQLSPGTLSQSAPEREEEGLYMAMQNKQVAEDDYVPPSTLK